MKVSFSVEAKHCFLVRTKSNHRVSISIPYFLMQYIRCQCLVKRMEITRIPVPATEEFSVEKESIEFAASNRENHLSLSAKLFKLCFFQKVLFICLPGKNKKLC